MQEEEGTSLRVSVPMRMPMLFLVSRKFLFGREDRDDPPRIRGGLFFHIRSSRYT